MAIALASVAIKHERRVRLVFTANLGGAAFATSLYSVANDDGQAASPLVVAVFVVAGSPHVVELQLSADLVQGAQYTFSAPGVPDGLGGFTPDPSDVDATFGQSTVVQKGAQAGVSELDGLLYGVDVLFAGGDWVEGQDGDLQTLSGTANLHSALNRRALSEGLPWDATYGVKARRFVDAPAAGLAPARAVAETQMRADDRVAAAKATVTTDNVNSTGAILIDVTPIGAGAGALPAIKVPVATS